MVNVKALISDEADLKLKEIEVALRAVSPDVRRPQAIEAAILAARPLACVRDARRRARLVGLSRE